MADRVVFDRLKIAKDEWETPDHLFDELDFEFDFTLDAAASFENAKCGNYYNKEDDALIQDWGNNIVWLNPPYGRSVGNWVEKSSRAASCGAIVVMLLAARTDTKWFHAYIYKKAEIRFLKGRLKFGGSKNSAPFPSMVVIFRPK